MEKQKTLYQQARLHDRGAAEMVLQMISASKGQAPYRPPPCRPVVLKRFLPVYPPLRYIHMRVHPFTCTKHFCWKK